MGFRGVLLFVGEEAAAAAAASSPTATTTNFFRVVCPDASLQIQTTGIPRKHILEKKMLVTDFVTSELQQVTRLSGALLQSETHSVLWAAVVPLKMPDKETAHSSTFPFDPLNLVRRVCYTFYFRSMAEFEIFARAHAAARREQQYTLTTKSVRLELAAQQHVASQPTVKSLLTVPVPAGHEELKRRREQLRKDIQKRVLAEREQLQAKAICEKAAKMEADRVKAAAAAEAKQRTKERQSITTAPSEESGADADVIAAAVPSPPLEECILCGADSTCRRFAGKFVNHPYLLKDGRGNPVIVCKVCLQLVLKRRVDADRARGGVLLTKDDLCGLCTAPVATINGESKACTHPQCPRVYCPPCLKKLFGKAQANKVFRTKKWLCPNCETPGGETGEAPADEEDADADGGTKKKRKRDHNDKVRAEEEALAMAAEEALKPAVDIDAVVARDPNTGETMTPLDYASTYFEFLTNREEQPTLPPDSEDVCFCCKDGGDVLECDWKQCPKVYHADCLGYPVEEGVEWFCPRHRCFKCGFSAKFACRLCVTSFCKADLPSEIKLLGPATAEISGVTYVLCTACDHMATKALEQKKISRALYERLLHPPSGRKQLQRSSGTSSGKQKKRLR